VGEPPFTGVAVNVTDVPSQIAPKGFAAIDTLTGSVGLTVILFVAERGVHVPTAAVSVRVATPLKAGGGVHVAPTVLAFGKKVPPTRPSDQVKAAASPPADPPRTTFVLP
jgi:hypothetical protein